MERNIDDNGGAARIRVLIVDDHPMLREGLVSVLELEPDLIVVGQAASGLEAIDSYLNLRPDITLMDIQMPGLSGVDAIAAIREHSPSARVIVLTTYAGDAQALRALKAGAVGYLPKSSIREELLQAVRAVHAGRHYLPPELALDIAIHATEDPLTERETEILRLISAGNSNKQAAWRLSIAEETVKSNLKSVFAKLSAIDRTHAVAIAVKRGIIEL